MLRVQNLFIKNNINFTGNTGIHSSQTKVQMRITPDNRIIAERVPFVNQEEMNKTSATGLRTLLGERDIIA